MSINYSLIPNHLTDDPSDYMAVVQDQQTRTMDDIIDEMADRGSTVTKADILSVMEDYQAVLAKFLSNGDRINTPLFKTSASISGVFEDQTNNFDRFFSIRRFAGVFLGSSSYHSRTMVGSAVA